LLEWPASNEAVGTHHPAHEDEEERVSNEEKDENDNGKGLLKARVPVKAGLLLTECD